MPENNYKKYIKLLKKVLLLMKPRFSFHYVAYTIMTIMVVFSVISVAKATTPNPGHPWNQVGDGVFAVTNNQTALRTYTFPNADATVLTTNAAVTVAQGGTGVQTITGIVIGNGTSNMTGIVLTANQSIRRNAANNAYEGFTPAASGDLAAYLPLAGGTMTGNILMTSNKLIGGSTTTSDLNFQTTSGVGATGADMHFLVGNNGATEAMTILNSGNVGIGTMTPGVKLDVVGGAIRTDNQLISTIVTGTAPLSVASTTVVSNLNADMLDDKHASDFALTAQSTYYIEGTGTVAGTWLGSHPNITSYYDGLTIRYYIPIAGTTTDTLDINSLGAKIVYLYGTTKLTTHYPALSVITLTYSSTQNGGSWFVQPYYADGTESYTVRWNSTLQAGAPIYDYKLVMFGASDGKVYPLTLETGTATTKTVSSVEFNPMSPVLFYNSATDIALDGTSTSYWYEGITSTNLHYTANQASGWTAYTPIYLKGTITSSGNFLLAGAGTATNPDNQAFLTQTLPTTEDGFVYMLLGHTYSTTSSFRLTTSHPIYEYKGGKLRPYTQEADTLDSVLVRGATTDETPTFSNATYSALFTGGNVGIGTTGPLENFHIQVSGTTNPSISSTTGMILSSTTSTGSSGQLSIISGNTGGSRINFGDTDDENIGVIEYLHDTNMLSFRTNAISDRMVINSLGNVGIGTTTPLDKLGIIGNIGINPSYVIGSGFGYTGGAGSASYATLEMYSGSTGYTALNNQGYGIKLKTAGTDRVTILNGGNVGIGTTSPTAVLHLKAGTATASTAPLKLTAGTNLTTPEAGAVEWDGTNLFVTQTTGPTRKTIAYTDSNITGIASKATNLVGGNSTTLLGSIPYQSNTDTTTLLSPNTTTTAKYLTMTGTGTNGAVPAWTTIPISIVNSSTSLFSTGLTDTGSGATAAYGSVFLGQGAGYSATSSSYSNFIGYYAGSNASAVNYSNFLGRFSGELATNASNSNFFGWYSGNSASSASNSNFMGTSSGYQAINASNSNMFGNNSGYQATNASYTNFLGYQSGYGASDASYSNLLGYQTGKDFTSNTIGSNNVIIGTNISLANATANSINLGGVIFAKNTYATTTGNPSITGTATGSVGIGVVPASISARLHLPAGTATAGTAPFKLTAGTNLTTAEAGAMEYDGTNLYFTPSGTIRKTIAYTTDLTTGYVPYTGANANVNLGTYSLTTPNIIGGSATTQDLTLQTTTGIGATGADMHFLVGNNGATEAMTILNSGNVGIGTTSPTEKIEVVGNIYINNSGGYLKFYNGFKFTDGVGTVTVTDSGNNTIMVFDEL